MATRIAFSTHYPDRMKELAGKPTRFPEKILKGIYDGSTYWIGECPKCKWVGSAYHAAGGHGIADTGDYSDVVCPKCYTTLSDSDYDFGYYGQSGLHPKTTTIRSNYEYWKSKEGQLLQPFFWAGRPYHSKNVVFCPEVRLRWVRRVHLEDFHIVLKSYGHNVIQHYTDPVMIKYFTQNEGFDHPDHFWMWFDQDFNGAYLELESVGG